MTMTFIAVFLLATAPLVVRGDDERGLAGSTGRADFLGADNIK
jgi:hypothetical protein